MATLAEVARKANEAHMTYGQYVAQFCAPAYGGADGGAAVSAKSAGGVGNRERRGTPIWTQAVS